MSSVRYSSSPVHWSRRSPSFLEWSQSGQALAAASQASRDSDIINTYFYLKHFERCFVAAVTEWYWYRNVAGFVMGSSPVPLKTRRVGQRCTLNLSRAETSSRGCGLVVRRGRASSGVVHVT
ncbi:uncharacterized protein TNCV_3814591 [Trichonephila clavipes]|nr:uncharacterized protein TNCV_3814591 [Trichonephila clavipes]